MVEAMLCDFQSLANFCWVLGALSQLQQWQRLRLAFREECNHAQSLQKMPVERDKTIQAILVQPQFTY